MNDFTDEEIKAELESCLKSIYKLTKERDELKLELSESGYIGFNAKEAECLTLNLNNAGVVTHEGLMKLSLWGRVCAYKEQNIPEIQAKAAKKAYWFGFEAARTRPDEHHILTFWTEYEKNHLRKGVSDD